MQRMLLPWKPPPWSLATVATGLGSTLHWEVVVSSLSLSPTVFANGGPSCTGPVCELCSVLWVGMGWGRE